MSTDGDITNITLSSAIKLTFDDGTLIPMELILNEIYKVYFETTQKTT